MCFENGGKEQRQPLHKFLPRVTLLVKLSHCIWWHDICEVGDEVRIHLLNPRMVFGVHSPRINCGDFREALQSIAAKGRLWEEFVQKHVYESSLENINQRDPKEKAKEALRAQSWIRKTFSSRTDSEHFISIGIALCSSDTCSVVESVVGFFALPITNSQSW